MVESSRPPIRTVASCERGESPLSPSELNREVLLRHSQGLLRDVEAALRGLGDMSGSWGSTSPPADTDQNFESDPPQVLADIRREVLALRESVRALCDLLALGIPDPGPDPGGARGEEMPSSTILDRVSEILHQVHSRLDQVLK